MSPLSESTVPDDARFLSGISASHRLAIVRWLALAEVRDVGDMAVEWPAISVVERASALSTLASAGWVDIAVGGSLMRNGTQVRVPVTAVARLVALIQRLDPNGVAVDELYEVALMRELRILRLAPSRMVLALSLDRPRAHPREFVDMPIDRAWVGWTELHEEGWLVDGCPVPGRPSQVRRLAIELLFGTGEVVSS